MKTYEQFRLKISSPKAKHKSFVRDFWGMTYPHPFDERIRILDNVMIQLSPTSDDIHIQDIRALEQGKGTGTKALKKITDLADKHNVVLGLFPVGYASTSDASLRSWYKRAGFEPSPNDYEYMVRYPV